jgi:hypothetical protein
MTGYVVQWFGYGSLFILMGVLHPISYLLMRRMVRRPLEA